MKRGCLSIIVFLALFCGFVNVVGFGLSLLAQFSTVSATGATSNSLGSMAVVTQTVFNLVGVKGLFDMAFVVFWVVSNAIFYGLFLGVSVIFGKVAKKWTPILSIFTLFSWCFIWWILYNHLDIAIFGISIMRYSSIYDAITMVMSVTIAPLFLRVLHRIAFP